MKRFISALSSFCLAATSVLSSFTALTASAAAGAITITGDKVSASAGQKVEFGFKVSDASEAAGMQLFFDFDGLQNVEMVEELDNPAYFVSPVFNESVGSFVWGGATDMAAEDGGDLVIFTATVPSNAKSTYEVKLNSSEKNAVRNRNMEDLTINFTSAVISVAGGSDVGGDDPSGAMNITGNKVSAKAGETVQVAFKVTDDPGTAGMQLFFDFDGLTNVKMIEDLDNPAYFASPVFNASVGSFVWGGATDMVAEDGGDLVIFEVTIPANAKSSYSIGLNSSEKNAVRNREMEDITYKFTNAVITVTGSAPIEGAMNITGQNVTAKPGDTVQVAFQVSDDPGTAGMQLFFDFDGLTNVAMIEDLDNPAYFVSPVFNESVGSFVWGGATDMVAEDGGDLVIFEVKIPTNAKSSYTIDLNRSEKNAVRNREMQDVVYNFTAAVITVTGGSDIVDPPADGMRLVGDNVTAPAGSTVQVGCKVYDDPGTAGMQLFFDFDGLTNVTMIEDLDEPAYFVSPVFNDSIGSFVWGGATDMVAEDGGYLVVFEVEIPANAKDIYEITLNQSEKNAIRNRNMEDITYSYSPMVITVGEPLPPVEGEITLTGDKVTAKAGETVEVAVKIYGDPGSAGMQMFLDFGKLEDVSLVDRKNPAYFVDMTANLKEGFIGWGGAKEYVAEDGSDLIRLRVTVPESAKAGDVFKIQLRSDSETKIQNLNMQDIPYTFSPIEITVGDTETTTSATTTTTTETDPIVPAGKSEWTIDTVTAAPNDIVSVPVKVTNDEGTSGFVVTFDYKEGLIFDSITWGSGYTGEATINGNALTVVWADASGKDAVAGSGEILSLNFKTPDAAGVYPVTFEALEVVNTSGNALSVTKTNGAVIIDPTAQPTAKSDWTIGTVTVQAGAEVAVPVTVENDEGTSGFVVTFDYDEALTFKNIEWGEGYTGEATINGNALTVVWADNSGNNVQAGSGNVMTINFTAPDAAGTYPVTFADLEVVDTDGNPLNVTQENGAVIVTTEAVVPAGKSNWTIGTETVEGGAKAAIPVTVTEDEGTSGFVVTFDYDEALTFDGFTWGEGYTGEATLNGKELTVVWAEAEGKDAVAGADPVLYLNFTAPAEAGNYPVTFAALEVVNTSGNALEVTKTNGAVIVSAESVVPAGKSNWTIGTETVAKGADVSVPVTVTDDEGTSGFVVTFDYDDALTFEGFTWGEGYTGEATLNGKELTVVWAEADGKDAVAEDAPVLYLNFTAPDEVGEYPVTFAALEVVNTSGNALDVTKTDGAVIVVDEVTTTSTSDTTITTETTTTETTTSESTTTESSTTTETTGPVDTTTSTTKSDETGTTTSTTKSDETGTTTSTTKSDETGTTTSTTKSDETGT
ncbi:MAG: hypothetical protein IKL87_00195, partial [Oscillospiraceae bacterium]|nr:hypothetical protein [Oscillospiraceae bacterium]